MADDPDPKPADGATAGAPQLRKKDTRQSLTLKGSFTPELRTRIARAARMAGQTQTAYLTDLIRFGTDKTLRGEPFDGSQAMPPADVVDELTTTVLERVLAAVEARDRGARAAGVRARMQRAWEALMGRH